MQSEALPQPAEETYHEVTVSTPIADGCAVPSVPVLLHPPQCNDQYYRTHSGCTVRPPSRYLDMVSQAPSPCDFAYTGEEGNVAYATMLHANINGWH